MNLATWSIRQPIPVVVVFLLAALAGTYGFFKLPVQDMPDIALPTVTITARFGVVAPAQMETDVTRKIEDSVANVQGVRHLASVVSIGTSITTVEFELGKDLGEAVHEVRDAIARIRVELPLEVQEPVVEKVTTAGPIQTYSMSAPDMDEEALSWFIDTVVTRKLLGVSGVGAVSRIGGVQREIHVDLDPTQLAAFGVTAAETSRALQRAQQDASGGIARVGEMRQSVRTDGTLRSARDFENFDIALPAGRNVRLGSIARVSDTTSEPTELALLDGQPVVAFQIVRARGASEVSVARLAALALEEIEQQQPGMSIRLVDDTVAQVEEQFRGSLQMLVEGAVLAMLVVAAFLRNWPATWIAALALPLSVLPTFAVMNWAGFSLNTVTFLALTLVIGILVDDAIVEIENIQRHRHSGESPRQAAIVAVNEIGLAVVATTLTLVAVFLPTAFMGGVAGLFFMQFGWTASLAVLASLAVARLVTPMLAARFLTAPATAEAPKDGRLQDRYLRLLAYALAHRGGTLLVAAGLFAGSLALIPLLESNFMPPSDRSQTQISLELAPGATLQQTHEAALQVTRAARTLPEVTQVFVAIGSGASGELGRSASAGDVHRALISVRLTPRNERSSSQIEIEQRLRETLDSIPGARIAVRGEDSGDELEFALGSEDGELLDSTARRIEQEIRTVPGLVNVRSTASLQQPQVVVTPDFARAAELGVDTESIGETLRVAFGGDFDWALAKLTLPERQLNVRVQLPERFSSDLQAVRALKIPAARGLVPLGSVADVRLSSGAAEIQRFDRQRSVTIQAELHDTSLGDVSSALDALPAVRTLPAAVHRLDTGDAELMAEVFGGFAVAMLTGILCVYLILVLLFQDFLQPLTILCALPLALGGAFAALLVTGFGLSLPSLLGLLMLMGVVTKNSILLVDYAITAMRRDGRSPSDAVMEACRLRARPILMTTLAMTAGMLPVALGLSANDGFRAPMAVAVIGGLATSTLLSLIVVPVVFTYIEALKRLRRPAAQPVPSQV
jgi:hydrophobe/amphiphile efflux-1 (HAE1) family protein